MMAQRDAERRDLDIRPRTLLAPPELQQTAKELLLSDFIQRANNDVATGNALKNALDREVESRLSNSDRFTGTSTKAWYLLASPADAAIIVAFLRGKQSPTVEFFGLDADPKCRPQRGESISTTEPRMARIIRMKSPKWR